MKEHQERRICGGWSRVDDISENSKEAYYLAARSPENYANNIHAKICVTKFCSLEQQVVSGMNYRFRVQGFYVDNVDQTQVKNPSSISEMSIKEFIVQVYEQSWTQTYQVTRLEEVV